MMVAWTNMAAMIMEKWLDSGYILKVKSIGFPDGSVVSSEEERQHEITI